MTFACDRLPIHIPGHCPDPPFDPAPVFSDEEVAALLEAVRRDPEPTEALIRALARHKEGRR